MPKFQLQCLVYIWTITNQHYLDQSEWYDQ